MQTNMINRKWLGFIYVGPDSNASTLNLPQIPETKVAAFKVSAHRIGSSPPGIEVNMKKKMCETTTQFSQCLDPIFWKRRHNPGVPISKSNIKNDGHIFFLGIAMKPRKKSGDLKACFTKTPLVTSWKIHMDPKKVIFLPSSESRFLGVYFSGETWQSHVSFLAVQLDLFLQQYPHFQVQL